MRVSVVFGALSLMCSAGLAVLTFFGSHFPFAVVRHEGASGYAFLLGAAFFVPFVLTYTKLGLNSDENGPVTSETKARRAELGRRCPIWRISWYCAHAFMGGVLILGFFTRVQVQPFFAFSSAICFINGMWFVFGYPVARRIFNDHCPLRL